MMECYICGARALPQRQLCVDCAQDYTDLDVAAKRFLAAWLMPKVVNRYADGNRDA